MAMEKLLHSIRIGGDYVVKDELFEEFLRSIETHPCGIRQVAMFLTPSYHTPTRLENFTEYLPLYEKRLQQLRDKGYSAGLDILATIGHHEENLPFCYADDSYYMTDLEGNVCKGSHCMNDPGYIQNYVIPLYRMFAKLKPDFIWIDDDIRYFHWPLKGPGCFCDGCIELFNRTHGTAYTRETLKTAFDQEDGLALRKKWMEQQLDAVAHLLRVIGTTVREVSEDIVMGFMECEMYVMVYDITRLAAALSDNGRYEIMWRPGSGCYNDYNFDDFVKKAEKIGRINAYLPPYVTSIQSEIENYPCDLLSKTPTSSAAETLLYMATGCTGAALSLLPLGLGGDTVMAENHLRAVNRTIPYAGLLKEKLQGTKIQGIHTGWGPYSYAALPAARWNADSAVPEFFYASGLFRMGLPECYCAEEAQVTMLNGDFAKAYTDEELKKLLSGGLVLGPGALEYLNSRGFEEYTGFRVGEYHELDAIEMYTEDEMNEGLVGEIRNCRPVFGAADSFALIPVQEGARVLSKLVDYNNDEIAACASGLYENSLGGRIYSVGYHPYSELSYYWKGVQLKRIFVYLSKDTLPSYTVNHYRLFHTAHKGDGKNFITLFNPTNEHFEDITVMALTQKEEVDIYTQAHPEAPAKAVTREAGAYRSFTIDHLPPYEMVLIEV